MKRRTWAQKYLIALLVILVLIFFMFPIFWLIMTSLRTRIQTISYPPVFLFRPVLIYYQQVLFNSHFPQALLNSAIIGCSSTAIVLLLSIPSAYSLARFTFRRKEDVSFYVISTKMAPPIVVLFAFYMLFSQLKLSNTRTAITILHIALNLPLTIWLLRGFFEAIPAHIEEAARLDGCGEIRILWKVTIPIVLPGIAIATMLSLMFSWIEFLFAVTVGGLQSQTGPVLIYSWLTFTQIEWGEISAASVIFITPVVIIGLVIRKHLVRGMTFGLVK